MPFPFVYVCDLLDKLESICVREVPLLRKDRVAQTKETLVYWFVTHRWRINAQDTHSKAVLMILKPERQTDREYGVEKYLEQILARIFKMPTPMYEKLRRWRDDAHNHGDLGSRLCQIMQEMNITPSSATASKISVEEIDQSLLRIAIFNDGSSLAVKSLKESNEKLPDRIDILEALYTQLQPREAKWLTRIILKNYGPVTLPDKFPLPGNVTHLPNSLLATFQFPPEPPTPERRTGTRVKKGIGLKGLAHPLPTPPTSSPILPNPEPVQVVNKPAPRYRIGWDPQSSTLSAPVKLTAPPVPATSSPLPEASAPNAPRTTHKLVSPPPSSLLAASCINAALAQVNGRPKRSALGQISSNIPSGSQSQQSQTRSQDKNIPNSSNSQCSHSRSRHKSTTASPVVFSNGKCLLTQKRCQLSSALFILSPSLDSNPYLLTKLIPYHGAHHITSLSSLSHPTVPRRTKSGRRVKKFILVDITRPEQTLHFCKQAEKAVRKLGWKTKNGHPEHIPIFDWRILESFAKLDRGIELGFDPVRKHFQGTI
ncbi:hypothetical protein BKA65DRAFT_567912 [Rhexocercosporidium sp. MPI-PUGE-AT-0058]|nr:hypothetical protein BKA65DRAFT_567912 [Rhexocercosporidium sp. MPI-PUGE-AT-0058]